MNKTQKIYKKVDNFLYDHYSIRVMLDYLFAFLVAIFSAFIFSLGFTCFVTPSDPSSLTLVTGGISGLTQLVSLIIEIIFDKTLDPGAIQAMGYSLFNLPLVIFSFIKIGKRFSIFTAINVLASSLFISLLSSSGVAHDISSYTLSNGQPLLDSFFIRALFAGVCSGIGSALSYKSNFSSGGIDIISYYLGLRKSTQVGKYSVVINVCIILSYSMLRLLTPDTSYIYAIYSISYSFIYLFVVALVIDFINLRNKKIQIQIFTKVENMPQILMSNLPHGATISHSYGAYTKDKSLTITMVVSSNEVKKTVTIAKKVDAHAFISVIPLTQVYGNFFIKPVE